MGCTFSSDLTNADEGSSLNPYKAMVVATDGSLLEYSGGILASEVMLAAGNVYALCNSDRLLFDAYPPATAPDEVLVPGQIYFLLPPAELNQRLCGAKLAALAVRASVAMKRAVEKQGRRRRIRVVPVAEVLDVEVGDGGGIFDLRSAATATEMKKKVGMAGARGKRVGTVLSTIEEVEEDWNAIHA